LNTLLTILINDILPIFIVIGLGYVFARKSNPDIRLLSRLMFLVLSPSLVFVSLTESNIEGSEVLQIAAFVAVNTLSAGALGWLLARGLRLTRPQTTAFVLTAMFVNAGNYGLGVTRLAFGVEAETRSVIYFVTSSVLVYTLGMLIASGFGGGWRGILKQLFSMPHIYALAAVLAIRSSGWTVPRPIIDGLDLPARATVPMMLVLLGMQLSHASVNEHWKLALAGSGLRLVVAPLIAVGFAVTFGLSGPAQQAGILEASMPAAVINTLIATEFDVAPKLVTSTVVLSTLLSPVTLSIIIALLQT
jgi:predicted permease